ncbi:MAG: 2Fe-2S iron-sulfur cluster binding domain-containing protein [Legionellales bacterium]|nr:2Fe-2S iron-sulfur cluster binding domain-containing protein [Legionellales bacterium]
MMFSACIQPDNLVFFIEPGESILDAALKQGFDFSYGCQQGVCGTCAAKLTQGKISYPHIDPIGLEEDEDHNDFILLCGAVPESDIELHHAGVSAPWQLPIKKASYQLISMHNLSPKVVQLFLKPATMDFIHFQAGQYVELFTEDGEHRPFSIANTPNAEGNVELHVHHTADNIFSTKILSLLAEQKTLLLEGPFGRCIYRKGLSLPLVFVAGGTGFTHSKAIIEHMIESAPNTPIHLFWGAKTPDDLYMNELPLRWQKELPSFRYTPTISRPDNSLIWQGKTTTLPKLVTELYPDLTDTLFYVSGSAPLVQEMLRHAQEHGLKRAFFFSDLLDLM